MGVCAATCCNGGGDEHESNHGALLAERPLSKNSKAPLLAVGEESDVAREGTSGEEAFSEMDTVSGTVSPMAISRRDSTHSTDTFFYVNGQADEKDDEEAPFAKLASNRNVTEMVDEVRTMAQESIAEEDGPKVAAAKMKALIENFIDREYDILAAELVFRELEMTLGSGDEWNEILKSKLFERFSRKATYFFKVGKAVCADQSQWLCIYEGGGSRITALVDKDDPFLVHYKANVSIPTSLTNVMAVANEVQLMREWNSLVSKEPRRIGRYTAHYVVLGYQLSMLGGMYKLDILNEIRRFTDVDGGFLVEYIVSADKKHPCYQEADKGYKRPQNELKNVWVACGPSHTMLIQMGKVKLPVKASQWMLSAVGKLVGQAVVGSLVKNSLRASEPSSPWEAALKQDETGFYERLRSCEASAASSSRTPQPGKAPEFNLDGHFEKAHFERWMKQRERQRNGGLATGKTEGRAWFVQSSAVASWGLWS
mmetsp:Transcript_67205/g.161015  ORF Transcript_67205/g.161015 Transcript_67205/m.161015 type:complete len:483 (+) Transcript_67205:170-1618(+)